LLSEKADEYFDEEDEEDDEDDEDEEEEYENDPESKAKHSNNKANNSIEKDGSKQSPETSLKKKQTKLNGTKSMAKTRSKKTKGRVKIKMEFIENKIRRYTTFSKRKTGIMKKVLVFYTYFWLKMFCWFLNTILKAYELSTLTGTQVMLLVASETGHVYTFATDKLQPMITSETGKNLIQSCLSQDDDVGSCSNFGEHNNNNGKICIENFNNNEFNLDDEFEQNDFEFEEDK
jgi:serum response factor